MNSNEILSIIITVIGLASFITIFTHLYKSYANSSITDIKNGKRDIELVNTLKDEENIKKKKKRLNLTKNILFYLFLALLVPTFIFAIVAKVSGSVTMIGGKAMMVVASGSMSFKNKDNVYINSPVNEGNYDFDNQFNKFDIIIIDKVEKKEDIRLYDVIAFKSRKGDNVIHRIINIIDDNGTTVYTTQGDALSVEDGLRPTFDDVIGVYRRSRIPGVGAIVLFAQSSAGMITILSLLVCLTMIDKFNDKIKKEEENRIEELKKVLDYKKDSEIQTEYYEEIIYNGYAYRFTSEGFKDKYKVQEREKKDD